MQTLSRRIAMLLVLTVAACGSGDPAGARCEIGRALSCPCVGGAVGVQECSPAGVYGACVCAAPDAGSDAPAATDAAVIADAPTVDAVTAADTSCSADLQNDSANCGACGVSCAVLGAHVASACRLGRCQSGCELGFADCDGNAANGCEVDTRSEVSHCGACRAACSSGRRCIDGACVAPPLVCPARRADCDGNAANGCETDITTVTNCGTCGNNCASVGARRCVDGAFCAQ